MARGQEILGFHALELAQGSAALGAPAAHALGGSVAAFSRAPAEAMGWQLSQGLGSDGLRRSFGRWDSGSFGHWRMALSAADWKDMNEYNDGKNAFIKKVEAEAVLWYKEKK